MSRFNKKPQLWVIVAVLAAVLIAAMILPLINGWGFVPYAPGPEFQPPREPM